MGYYGPKIVWIMMGYLSTTFWREKLDDIECTLEEMNIAAEGVFLFKHSHRDPDYTKGIANITGILNRDFYLM